jgi:hypothetical protein
MLFGDLGQVPTHGQIRRKRRTPLEVAALSRHTQSCRDRPQIPMQAIFGGCVALILLPRSLPRLPR